MSSFAKDDIRKWTQILKEQAESGLTKNEFCESRHIEKSMFYKWQRRIKQISSNEVPQFVELSAPTDDNKESASAMEVSLLPSMEIYFKGVTINTYGEMTDTALRTILRALRDA